MGWPWSTFCCTFYCWWSKTNSWISCQWIKETHELDIGGDSNSKHKKRQHYIKWLKFELLPLIEVDMKWHYNVIDIVHNMRKSYRMPMDLQAFMICYLRGLFQIGMIKMEMCSSSCKCNGKSPYVIKRLKNTWPDL